MLKQAIGVGVDGNVGSKTELASRTIRPGAFLPYRADREWQQRIGHDAFAKAAINERYLRTPDGRCRCIAGVADRDRERRRVAVVDLRDREGKRSPERTKRLARKAARYGWRD